MKAITEITLIAPIITFTIVLAVLLPPVIIKTTIDREVVFTYKFEKAQHTLLSLLSATESGRSNYEILGSHLLKIDLSKIPISFETFKNKIEKLVGKDYCLAKLKGEPAIITTYAAVAPTPSPIVSEVILGKSCTGMDAKFNTILVLPYNKNSLVEIIRIGLKWSHKLIY